MKLKLRRKRLKRRIKRMAACCASAALMSAVFLSATPAATAHASAIPVPDQPAATTQQVVKTPTGFHTVKAKVAAPVAEKTPAPAEMPSSTPQSGEVKKAVKVVQAAAAKDQRPEKQTNQGAPPADFEDVFHVKATAYAPGPHDNGEWGSLTHMGTTVRPGVIAVDPAVIPLGSRVYIEYPDGTGAYAVAEDTGGAIKGNRIDIAMSSVDAAYDFGIKNVKVYVLA